MKTGYTINSLDGCEIGRYSRMRWSSNLRMLYTSSPCAIRLRPSGKFNNSQKPSARSLRQHFLGLGSYSPKDRQTLQLNRRAGH